MTIVAHAVHRNAKTMTDEQLSKAFGYCLDNYVVFDEEKSRRAKAATEKMEAEKRVALAAAGTKK